MTLIPRSRRLSKLACGNPAKTRLVVATPPPSPPPLEVDDAEAHASEIELQVQDEARSLAPAPTVVLFRGLSRPDVGRHLMSNRSKLGLRITPRMVLPEAPGEGEDGKMPPAAAAAPAELRATTSASAFLPKSMRTATARRLRKQCFSGSGREGRWHGSLWSPFERTQGDWQRAHISHPSQSLAECFPGWRHCGGVQSGDGCDFA